MKHFYTIIKSALLGFLAIIFFTANAQYGFSPCIDSIKYLVTEESVSTAVRELSGDLPAIIGGEPYTLTTRYCNSDQNDKAAQYIYEKFQNYGLTPYYQGFNSKGTNVIAVKPGIANPEKQFIICAHYDDMPSSGTAPGCDDNASGTVAVLEAARLLSSFNFNYTIVFAAWDEEELGLLGSNHYADSVANVGDNILGVLNLDMIAWDSNNDNVLSISTDDNSQPLANSFVNILQSYLPQMSHNFINESGSDHTSFQENGYQAILSIEDMGDFNEYYHTSDDKFSNINIPYFTSMVQASVVAIASFAWDYQINIIHQPILSGNDTSARTAEFVIHSVYPVAQGEFCPRLYYKIDSNAYNVILPDYTNADTVRFIIPGQSMGTSIQYYFACQNTGANFIATLPAGGKGINPPGTQEPSETFFYQVANIISNDFCSNDLPLFLPDQETSYDTIALQENGVLFDVNVIISISHSYIGDLTLSLISPEGQEITLSSRNGSDSDFYTNTVFDDEAPIPIGSGTPPYTGSFIPEEPLSLLDGSPLTGNWVMKINDNGPGDDGNLTEYCLQMQYSDETNGLNTNKGYDYHLTTYPNPATSSAFVRFELPAKTYLRADITDMYGNALLCLQQGPIEQGIYIQKINTANWKQGVYFCRIQSGIGTQTTKMIIIK